MIICQWSNRVISRKLLSIIDIGENTICHFVSVLCFCSRKYFNIYIYCFIQIETYTVYVSHTEYTVLEEREMSEAFLNVCHLQFVRLSSFFNAFKTTKKIFNSFSLIYKNHQPNSCSSNNCLFYTFHTGWISISFFFVCVLKWLFIF